MYALVAAHLAHLVLNWNGDSFVICQSTRLLGTESDKHNSALPAMEWGRWLRLFGAVVVLLTTLNPLDVWMLFSKSDAVDFDHVSHAAHLFGACSGFIAGGIFLKARGPKTPILKHFRKFLLCVYAYLIGHVVVKCFYNIYKIDEETPDYCNWKQYEDVCQDQCYRHLSVCNCTVSFCGQC